MPVYIVTIRYAVEAENQADATKQAAFGGQVVVPLATAAQPGHHPVAVGITTAESAGRLDNLNQVLGRGEA
jgi:hypothetical protein